MSYFNSFSENKIMARIVYKEGFDGQNRLECIWGIEINLLNGYKALIYPKYSKKAIHVESSLSFWSARISNEIEALKNEDNQGATDALLICGSPAARFVTQFRCNHRIFALPTLLTAMEIQDQKDEINIIAETIEGADLINVDDGIWSCSRYNKYYCWYVNDHHVTADNCLYNFHLCVPTLLYR